MSEIFYWRADRGNGYGELLFWREHCAGKHLQGLGVGRMSIDPGLFRFIGVNMENRPLIGLIGLIKSDQKHQDDQPNQSNQWSISRMYE